MHLLQKVDFTYSIIRIDINFIKLKILLVIFSMCLLGCRNNSKPIEEVTIEIPSDNDSINENTGVKLEPDKITLQEIRSINIDTAINFVISDQELELRNLQRVDSIFNERYIKGNNEFIELEPERHGGAQLEHYHWGKGSHENGSIEVIMEYFSIDNSEARLFMLFIDDVSRLISCFKVAEVVNYPDAKYVEKSTFNNNLIVKTAVLEGVADYIDSTNTFMYVKDSIVRRYNVENKRQIKMVDSIFSRSTYEKN